MPLVFFDATRKPHLYGHAPESEVYGDIHGGARLVLRGDNFAPLGGFGDTPPWDETTGRGMACIFSTPGRFILGGNQSSNVSAMPASFISPKQIACRSPDAPILGPTPLYVNTTFNSSIWTDEEERPYLLHHKEERAYFTYYDASRPPRVRRRRRT